MKMKCRGFVIAAWLWMVLTAAAVDAGEAGGPRNIKIITPEWEGQTNRDGSGLFFDIIRDIYTPEDIDIVFQFAPWKRCQALLGTAHSDAMFCVWKSHADSLNLLTPKFPLYLERIAAVFKKASLFSWQGIHTMDYKRAVWLRGYNYDTNKAMQGVQLALIHEVDSYEDAWLQLNMDRFDFYIEALIDLDGYINENKVDMGLYQKEVLWKSKAYVAFSNTEKSRVLIEVFDRQMKKLFQSGRLADIFKKWNQPFFSEPWEAAVQAGN